MGPESHPPRWMRVSQYVSTIRFEELLRSTKYLQDERYFRIFLIESENGINMVVSRWWSQPRQCRSQRWPLVGSALSERQSWWRLSQRWQWALWSWSPFAEYYASFRYISGILWLSSSQEAYIWRSSIRRALWKTVPQTSPRNYLLYVHTRSLQTHLCHGSCDARDICSHFPWSCRPSSLGQLASTTTREDIYLW